MSGNFIYLDAVDDVLNCNCSTVIPKALVEQTDLAPFFYDAVGIT